MTPRHTTPRVARRTVLSGALQASAVLAATTLIPHGGTTPSASATSELPSGILGWDDPNSWPEGRVPRASDVAVVDRPIRVSGVRDVAGVRIEDGGSLEYDPDATTQVRSTGNVVVHGTLRMRPTSAEVEHRLTFVGVNESRFVGGGMAVLASDVGLWVETTGVLDVQGTARRGWNRTGTDPSWARTDEIRQAPYKLHDFTSFAAHPFGSAAPSPAGPLSDVRTEVFNVTRNVVIGGTPTGRAHVLFLHAVNPQHIRFVRFEHVGPRRLASDGKTDLVLGRYGLHFHHCMDGTRGSLVEGVVVAHCGSRAFVPHASNGITFRDCVSYDSGNEGYWWDADTRETWPMNAANDTVFDRCAAFGVGLQLSTRNDLALSGFKMGQGTGNVCTGSVVAGVARSGAKIAGFTWAENTGKFSSPWVFRQCVAHNNRYHGAYVWQGDPENGQLHKLEAFTAYRNGGNGILAGPYRGSTQYLGGRLVQNALKVSESTEFAANTGWGYRIERLTLDPGGLASYAMLLTRHKTSNDVPTIVRECDLRRGTAGVIAVNNWNEAGFFDFLGCTVDGSRDLSPTDFRVVNIVTGTRLRVQRRDGTAFEITDRGTRTIASFATLT